MNALVLFAKYPEPGKVKTRLAQTIGDQDAAKIYRYFVKHIIEKHRVNQYNYKLLTAVYPEDKLQTFRQEFPRLNEYFPQALHGHLGKKLSSAFNFLFNRKNYTKVIIIGTDSPALPNDYIPQALIALEKKDVVLGPATDGGYYLIGLKADQPELFQNIRWSSEHTLADTLAVIKRMRLEYQLLPIHYDVDTIFDLQKLLCEYPDLPIPPSLRLKCQTMVTNL